MYSQFSQGRQLTEAEIELAKAVMQTFATSEHDFAVVARLNKVKVARPSGNAVQMDESGDRERAAQFEQVLRQCLHREWLW